MLHCDTGGSLDKKYAVHQVISGLQKVPKLLLEQLDITSSRFN
jgi:hypothetical protein